MEATINLKQIEERMAWLGLPSSVMPEIEQKLKASSGEPFFLHHRLDLNKESVEVHLAFQRQFNGWMMPDAMGIRLAIRPENVHNENIFVLPPGDGVSVREAYNLMKGRAVHRPDGPDGSAHWMELGKAETFRKFSLPYPVASSLSVPQWLNDSGLGGKLDSQERAHVVNGLHQGDRVDVGALLTGYPSSAFLESNPGKNRVDVMDGMFNKVDIGELLRRDAPILQRHQRRSF